MEERPKVFGIGLNKTGTTSLGQALRQLGFRHRMGQRRLLREYRAGNMAPIFEKTDAFDSFEDWPFPLIYRELFDRYGDGARFVLTTRRSPEAWLESLKKHALRTRPRKHFRKLAFGYAFPQGNEEAHLQIYRRHLEEVRGFFAERGAEGQLLEVCWEHGHGWPELCGFLGLPVPDVPFPHANPAREPGEQRRSANERRIARAQHRAAREARRRQG